MEFEFVTTEAKVSLYKATKEIFAGIIKEMRELSKKKPDATLNKGKVEIINLVLTDVIEILKDEPERKFLDLLTDDKLPQNSDAVLIMVQHETALNKFERRYHQHISSGFFSSETNRFPSISLSKDYEIHWITEKFLNSLKEKETELDLEDFDKDE